MIISNTKYAENMKQISNKDYKIIYTQIFKCPK